MRLMRAKPILRCLFLCMILLGTGVTVLDAQVGRGRERVRGKVLDADKNPLDGAVVVIKFKGHYRLDPNTRKVEFMPYDGNYGEMKFETTTNAKGQFRFIGLGYGQWEITATYGDLKPDGQILLLDKDIGRRIINLTLEENTPGTPQGLNFSSGGDTDDSDDSGDSDVIDFTKPLPDPPSDRSARPSRGVPRDPEKLFKLGEALLKRDELEKAARVFVLAAQNKPEWSKPYLKLGYTYFNLGEMENALASFQKFLELDPKSPEAPTVTEMVEILKEE